jgi:hypothetical protein
MGRAHGTLSRGVGFPPLAWLTAFRRTYGYESVAFTTSSPLSE